MADHDTHDHTGIPGVGSGTSTTTVADDTIWDAAGDLVQGTGANTAAKLSAGASGKVLTAHGAAAALTWETPGTGGVSSGTSNPGSPSSGDLFFRTDLGLLIYYDGTRWLTTGRMELDLAVSSALYPVASGGGTNNGLVPVPSGFQMWLLDWTTVNIVVTTNNGSHYVTHGLYRTDSANSSTLIGSTWNTSADTATVWTRHTNSINAALDASALTLQVTRSVTGTPGVEYSPSKLTYRLIVT